MSRSQSIFKKSSFFGNKYTSKRPYSTKTMSSSSKKLKVVENSKSSVGNAVSVDLLNILLEASACFKCHTSISKNERVESRKRLASYLYLNCSNCGFLSGLYSSRQAEGEMDVNIRAVYRMRFVGRGHQSMRKFCAIMNLPCPPAKAAYHNF